MAPALQTVPQGEHDIVFFQDGDDAVEFFIQRIFPVVGDHPGNHADPALAHQPAVAVSLLSQPLDGIEVDAAVDRHEGNSVLTLLLDQIEQHLLIKLVRIAVLPSRLAKSLVQRNIPDRDIDSRNHLAPHPVQIAAHGKLHERVRAGCYRGFRFPDLCRIIDDVRRGADGCIDFRPKPFADARRLSAF